MKNTYRVEMTPDHSHAIESRTYPTLTAARDAIRKANGGRLYGRYIPEGEAVEGWNLDRHEGCNTAVIVEAK